MQAGDRKMVFFTLRQAGPRARPHSECADGSMPASEHDGNAAAPRGAAPCARQPVLHAHMALLAVVRAGVSGDMSTWMWIAAQHLHLPCAAGWQQRKGCWQEAVGV